MKHIKSFKKNHIDINFLNSVFKELEITFEENKKTYTTRGSSVRHGFYGSIIEPRLSSHVYLNGYDDYIEEVDSLYDLHHKIRELIQHVVDEYDCEYELEIFENGESNTWVDTIKKTISIKFFT